VERSAAHQNFSKQIHQILRGAGSCYLQGVLGGRVVEVFALGPHLESVNIARGSWTCSPRTARPGCIRFGNHDVLPEAQVCRVLLEHDSIAFHLGDHAMEIAALSAEMVDVAPNHMLLGQAVEALCPARAVCCQAQMVSSALYPQERRRGHRGHAPTDCQTKIGGYP
jgi:hypothetical protein